MSRYLALDWDQQMLHVVSGMMSGKSCTVQKAAVWQEAKSPNPLDAEELGDVLKRRLKEAGIAAAPVLAVVPRDAVILKDLRIPSVPPHEEPALVRFQTLKELTHREEEIVLDYKVMEGTATASLGNDRRVLAVVLRRELLETYQRLCSTAGLKLVGVTPRPFGLAVALQRIASSQTDTTLTSSENAVAMVLIAGRWGEFSVFRGDIPVLTRSINVGGNLAAELRRNLTVYAGQSPQHPVRAVYLCGEISDSAREALSGALPDLPFHSFDPFAGVAKVDVPEHQRSGFTAAIGVLYARARKAGLPINFLEPRQPKPPVNPNSWLIYAAAGGLSLLLAAGAVYGFVERNAANDNLTLLREEQQQLDLMLAQEKARSKKLQALDEWDNVNELAEIHELNKLIPDVDTLRVTKFVITPLKKTAVSPYIAEITMTGDLLNESNPRKPLDDFIAALRKDPLYSVKAPTIAGAGFVLKVKVEKRPLKSL